MFLACLGWPQSPGEPTQALWKIKELREGHLVAKSGTLLHTETCLDLATPQDRLPPPLVGLRDSPPPQRDQTLNILCGTQVLGWWKNIHRLKPETPVLVSNNYYQKLSQKWKNTKTVVGHLLWISAAFCGKVGHVISFSCLQWVNPMVLTFAFWCNISKLPKLACPTLWGIL